MTVFSKRLAAIVTAAGILCSAVQISGSAEVYSVREEADAAKSTAMRLEAAGDYINAYSYYSEACRLYGELCKSGEYDRGEYEMLCALRDSLDLSPEPVYIADSDMDGIFVGSDDTSDKTASAVKLTVTLGISSVSDVAKTLSATSGDRAVLVVIETNGTERQLRSIAQGNLDSLLAKELRDACKIEGRIMISFCPSINSRTSTATLAQSFIEAYRRVATLCRRYAPSAKTVFTLADIHVAGGTAANFYPGDGYVDVLGVELCHTYSGNTEGDPSSAFDCRGSYYDPVKSTLTMLEEMREVAGDLPAIVESASFPWAGKAAISGDAESSSEDAAAAALKRYYTLLPTEVSGLTAIFYSGKSSAYGVTNLRRSDTVKAAYDEARALPFYRRYSSGTRTGAVSGTLESLTFAPASGEISLALKLGGMYSSLSKTYVIDSSKSSDELSEPLRLTDGVHAIAFYAANSDASISVRLDYTVTVSNGTVSCEKNQPKFDYNRNGILDFGDSSLLLAAYSSSKSDIDGIACDINGDGRFTMSDILALMRMMNPKYA